MARKPLSSLIFGDDEELKSVLSDDNEPCALSDDPGRTPPFENTSIHLEPTGRHKVCYSEPTPDRMIAPVSLLLPS